MSFTSVRPKLCKIIPTYISLKIIQIFPKSDFFNRSRSTGMFNLHIAGLGSTGAKGDF